MKIRGSAVSSSFISAHPPEDKKEDKGSNTSSSSASSGSSSVSSSSSSSSSTRTPAVSVYASIRLHARFQEVPGTWYNGTPFAIIGTRATRCRQLECAGVRRTLEANPKGSLVFGAVTTITNYE